MTAPRDEVVQTLVDAHGSNHPPSALAAAVFGFTPPPTEEEKEIAHGLAVTLLGVELRLNDDEE